MAAIGVRLIWLAPHRKLCLADVVLTIYTNASARGIISWRVLCESVGNLSIL